MQLSFIEGYTKPKAVLDSLFLLKAEIVKVARDIAYYQLYEPIRIPYMKERLRSGRLLYLIEHFYYDFLQAKDFDHRFHTLLALNGFASTEGYSRVQITEKIMKETDGYTSKPLFLPLPLYYDNAVMTSAYTSEFEMKTSTDIFGQEAMIIRGDDGRQKYFALLNPYGLPYPIFTQPFLLAEGIQELFTPYGTTFKIAYRQLKGYLRLWYGIELLDWKSK